MTTRDRVRLGPRNGDLRAVALRESGAVLLAGRRLDMGELAGRVGVNRTTLYRWFGSKDQLVADALWNLAERTLAHQEESVVLVDGPRAPQLLAAYTRTVIEHPGIRAFLERDTTYAFALLTGPRHGYHARFVARIHAMLLRDHQDRLLSVTDAVPLEDLAYTTARIIEAFAHSAKVTGVSPDADRAVRVLRALLR